MFENDVSKISVVVYVDYSKSAGDISADKFHRQFQQLTQSILVEIGEGVLWNHESGIWGFFPSMQTALQFAETIVEQGMVGNPTRALLAVGDVTFSAGTYTSSTITVMKGMIARVAYEELWLLPSAFYALDTENSAWDEIGTIESNDGILRLCHRIVLPNQCFIPSLLKKASTEKNVVICEKGKEPERFTKNAHVVFVGYSVGPELYQAIARTSSSNDKIWLVAAHLSEVQRQQWFSSKRNLIVATTDAFLEKFGDILETSSVQNPNMTMLLDGNVSLDVNVSLVGIALPKVPMARIIDGYSIDLLADGTWGYGNNALLSLHVSATEQTIVAHVPGCRLNSREMTLATPHPLGRSTLLAVQNWNYRFVFNVGQMYVGLIIGEAFQNHPVRVGARIEVGRQPSAHGFVLPDRGGHDKILWANNPQAQAAKDNALTLDRALTSRHHASINVVALDRFVVSSIHDKLPSFLMHQTDMQLKKIEGEENIRGEALLVIGTNLLKISKA